MLRSKPYPRRVLVIRVFLSLLVTMCCACKEELIHNLEEQDANKLLARLHYAAIEADKVLQPDERWSVAVAPNERARALQLLNDSRLIRDDGHAGIEKGGLLASRDDQRFKYERALSRSIESTLTSIAGVLEARVHLNIPAHDALIGLMKDKPTNSGSVLLVVEQGASVGREEIASLVGGAAGIERANISVFVTPTSYVVPKTIEFPTKAEDSAFIGRLMAATGGMLWEFVATALIVAGASVRWFLLKGKRRKIRTMLTSTAC